MLSGTGFALRSSGSASPFAGAEARTEGGCRLEGVRVEEIKMRDEGRTKKKERKGEEKCFGCKEKTTEGDREKRGGVMG